MAGSDAIAGPPPTIRSFRPAEQHLLRRFVDAFEARDVQAVVGLLTEDVWVPMPPLPLEYHGRDLARQFFATVAFRPGPREHLMPTRANGQPAVGAYLLDPQTGQGSLDGLIVLTLSGESIGAVTRFGIGSMHGFPSPPALPGRARP